MEYLTQVEHQSIVQLIRQQDRHLLTHQQFTDICFVLFEDISGMEAIATSEAIETIENLWSIYLENSI